MATRLIRKGFKVLPVMSLYDEDDDRIIDDVLGAEVFVPDRDGELALYHKRDWPIAKKAIEDAVAKDEEQKAQLAKIGESNRKTRARASNPRKSRPVKTVGQKGGITAAEVHVR
jgi:hypothetical protein